MSDDPKKEWSFPEEPMLDEGWDDPEDSDIPEDDYDDDYYDDDLYDDGEYNDDF